ncbi:MAG: BGTF surface domain-containing protein [Halobacteriales archaeon]|nr:BGTF surface domain-containing protein [Halobacteriales archaeon]
MSAAAVGAEPSASLTYEGEALTLYPASEQTVEGTSDLEAGSTIAVRLRSSGSSPFLMSEEATVGDAGQFEASFNLSGVAPGTEATVKLHSNGTELASAPVEIVEEPSPSPTETPGQPGFGAAVAVLAVLLGVLVRHW